MKHLLTIISAILLFTACSKDDDSPSTPPEPEPARRTVIVYMVGENNLDPFMQNDINEMREGRKQVAASENLVLYVDKLSKTEMPFIAKVNTDGNLDTLYRYEQDFYSSDPDNMIDVIDRIYQMCPAKEDYGLVLWGHASGWLMEDSVATRRGYGIDTGDNELRTYFDERSKESLLKGKWLNIPSMREAFKMLPMKWKFIMCDCCNMMNVEDGYELRDVTDYLIGSPAEIPGNGAPYNTLVPTLFLHTENFYQAVIDAYADHYYNLYASYPGIYYPVPLSVIKTSEMEALAEATRPLLSRINEYVNNESNLMDRHIYYNNTYVDGKRKHIMFDVREVVRKAFANEPSKYENWHQVFQRAVPYNRIAEMWQTDSFIKINFNDFTVTDDYFSGVSMFFPMEQYGTEEWSCNKAIKKMSWYYAVGWPSLD
jgi:hypothetical protein